MLYLYCGTDEQAVRTAALAQVQVLAPGARVERPETATLSPGVVADMLGAQSLFGEATVYLVDTPSAVPELAAALQAAAPDLATATNTVVVIEGALTAPEKKRWHGAELVVCNQSATVPAPNLFVLADALATRDKKQLWILVTTFRQAGLSAEEMIGILWWQLKTLRLVAGASGAAAAGMKDFTYNKAKRHLSHFKAGELETLSRSLLQVYHEGHGGVKDIMVGLEEWVLRG